MAFGTNCEGGMGRGSEPSANLMAISQELAAERYSSVVAADSRSCAVEFSLCSAPKLQRKTLVSSKYFIFCFSAPSFCLRRLPEDTRAREHRNPLGLSSAPRRLPAFAWCRNRARGPTE